VATPGGRYLNWINLLFTPEGSAGPVSILGVTSVAFDWQSKVIVGAGDGDMGPTSMSQTEIDPRFTVDLEHLAIMRTLIPGTRGTFSGTFQDSANGTGSGALTFTATNAMVENFTSTGRFRTYGTGQMIIRTMSSDGITPPVSIAVAA
jgi:hypothetical protein